MPVREQGVVCRCLGILLWPMHRAMSHRHVKDWLMVSTFQYRIMAPKIQLLTLPVDHLGQISQDSCVGRAACYGLEGKSLMLPYHLTKMNSR